MSEEDKNNPKDEKQENTSTKKEKITVGVDRSPEVDSLQQDLAKLKIDLQKEKDARKEEKETFDAEKTAIATKLQEKEGIIEQQATEQFEKEKGMVLELIKDSKLTDEQKDEIKAKLDTPKNLELVKGLLGMMTEHIKKPTEEPPKDKDKKPPDGKSTFTPPQDAEVFESPTKMLDELYNRAYYNPQKYTKEQVESAKTKIDTLLSSLIRSPSWKQLKRGEQLPLPQIVTCPRCGTTIVGEIPATCPNENCGFDFTRTGDKLRGRG